MLLRLEDHLLGPLKVELSEPTGDRDIEPEIHFSKPTTSHKMFRSTRVLSPNTKGYFCHETLVWPRARKLGANEGHPVRYEAITGALLEDLRDDGEEIELVSSRDAIRQITNAFLSRKQRQEFLSQYETFVEQAHVAPEVLIRAKKILLHQKDNLVDLNRFFEGLLDDDSFKPKIEEAAQSKIAQRVDDLAAQIAARAQEKVKEIHKNEPILRHKLRKRRTSSNATRKGAISNWTRK